MAVPLEIGPIGTDARKLDQTVLSELLVPERDELIALVKGYRQFLADLSTCSDPECVQAVCKSKREARAKIEDLFHRIGVK